MAATKSEKPETKEARMYRLRWWTLVTIGISILVTILDTTVMNVALPTIQRQLNATGSDLLWMVNAYEMVLGALIITTGSLADRFGRGKLLRIGLLIFGISSLAAFLSRSPTQLIIARIFMGTGAATIAPCTLSTITNVFPAKERGQAIGVWAGLNAVGLALGPIIGGMLVQHFNWNSIFIVNIPVVIVALILGWFFVPDTKDSHPRKLDLLGNFLALAGLAALIYGLISAGSRGWTDALVLGSLISSVIIIGLFILWERHTQDPLLDMGFFRNAHFSSGISIMAIGGLAMNGIIYVLTFYMQFVHGYDPLGAGLRFIPFAVGMLGGAILAGNFVKRMGAKWVMAGGFTSAAIVLFLLSSLKTDSSFWLLGTELILLGFSLGNFVSPISNIIMGSLPKDKTGIGSAINSTFTQITGCISVAVIGPLLGTIYTSRFLHSSIVTSGVPSALTQKASNSIGIAIGIAKSGQLSTALANLLTQIAKSSFMDAWHIIMLISSGILVVGAIMVLIFVAQRNEPIVEKVNEEHVL